MRSSRKASAAVAHLFPPCPERPGQGESERSLVLQEGELSASEGGGRGAPACPRCPLEEGRGGGD